MLSRFLPFQKSKFRNLRGLNGNVGDKLAYTINCFEKITSQIFQSQRLACLPSYTSWEETRISLGHSPTLYLGFMRDLYLLKI